MHNLAMQHEAGTDLEADEFYQEGLAIVAKERIQRLSRMANAEMHITETERQREAKREVALLEARILREQLKTKLLCHIGT
jgi:hypothetical protein